MRDPKSLKASPELDSYKAKWDSLTLKKEELLKQENSDQTELLEVIQKLDSLADTLRVKGCWDAIAPFTIV